MAKKKKTPSLDVAAVRQLLTDYTALKQQDREVQAALTKIKSELLIRAIANGGELLTPTHKVTAISQERKTLDRERLLERGVTPAILTYATKVSESTYVRVDERKLES